MKKLSLKLKLLLSFAFISLVVLIVGFIGFRSIGQLSHEIEEIGKVELPAVENAIDIQVRISNLMRTVQEYLNQSSTAEDRIQATAMIASIREEYAVMEQAYRALPMSVEDEQLFEEYDKIADELVKANNAIFAENEKLLKIDLLNPTELIRQIESFRADHYASIINASKQIEAGDSYQGGTDHTACRYGRWLLTFESSNPVINQVIRESGPTHQAFHRSIGQIQKLLAEGKQAEARTELHENLIPAADGVISYFNSMIAEANKAQAIFDEMTRIDVNRASVLEKDVFEALEQVVHLRTKEANATVEESIQLASVARSTALVLMLLGALAAMIYGALFGNRLSANLNRMSELIFTSASETKSAAHQVSEASSSLAEGASEQAASLEQTSSSMEEMTSMVARDAELAGTTSKQAVEADKSVKSGVSSMKKLRGGVGEASNSAEELSRAMDGIKASSDSISKIIKTIDEIAFQTNILALNAAVEAARAGEAGAGFAVVADEVRSLAHRAAEAASETQSLIEDSVKRSEEGVRVNAGVNKHLKEVLELADLVDKELNGIATVVASVDHSMEELRASIDEQQNGIEQINTGVVQINDVTQTNAASAEEAASASEELAAQANTLVDVVEELTELVNGDRKNGNLSADQSFSKGKASLRLNG